MTPYDLDRLQARLDLWCRNLIVGTLVVCSAATVATYVYLAIQIALDTTP